MFLVDIYSHNSLVKLWIGGLNDLVVFMLLL